MVKQEEKNKEEQQRDFLKEICVATSYADKKVIFVGVVDCSGKLLVGEYRDNKSKKKGKTFSDYIKPASFYSCILVSGLEKWKAELRTIKADKSSSCCSDPDFHFEVLELDILKLAITPLRRRGEAYLCIYFEPSASSQEIISKICKVI